MLSLLIPKHDVFLGPQCGNGSPESFLVNTLCVPSELPAKGIQHTPGDIPGKGLLDA